MKVSLILQLAGALHVFYVFLFAESEYKQWSSSDIKYPALQIVLRFIANGSCILGWFIFGDMCKCCYPYLNKCIIYVVKVVLFITTWYITILVMFLTFFLEHRLFLNSTASPLEWSIYAICVVYGIVFTLFLWYHCPLEWLLNPALSTQEQSVQDQQPTRPYQSPPNLYQSNPYQPNTSTALDNIIDYQNFNV